MENVWVSIAQNGVIYIALPWTIYVTVTLFNQRESIALLKQELTLLKADLQNSKDLYHLLKERLK